MHLAIPFAAERGAGPQLRNRLADACWARPGCLGVDSLVQAAPALSIEVTKAFGLELIGHHPEYEVPGKVSERWPPKSCLPAPAQFIDVKIAQARNLSVEFVSVWQRRTDANARHGAQAARLGSPALVLPSPPSVIRYARAPSTFCEMRFSLRRFRTTPAKKPRTECRCQPVACMIAIIVAPVGDESRAMTRDCFEPGFNVSAFRLRTAFCPDRPAVAAGVDWAGTWRVPLDSTVLGVGLAAERDARLTARFFADFDIEILHSVRGWRRTTEAPPRR